MPKAYSSPAIAEGKVFIGASDATGNSYMFAYYQNNGTLAWRTKTDGLTPGLEGFSSSPAYSNGLIFFGGDKTYALYASNGTVRWRVNTGGINYGDGTPTVAGDRVYIGGSDRKLYAIDQMTGTVDWTFQTDSSGISNYGLFSPPSIWNGSVYLPACNGYVYKINVIQAGPVANYEYRSARFGPMYGSPVVFDGKVYIGDGYYSPLSAGNRFRALYASNLSVVWEFYPGQPTSFFSSAAIAYGKLFVGSIEGNLYAIDPWTKTELWRYATGGAIWSSPAISDGKLFIGSRSGFIYSFNTNQSGPPAYNWRVSLGGFVDSAPAISDGLVCVGTFGNGGRVYCLGKQISPVDNPPTARADDPGGTAGQSYTEGSTVQVRWNAVDDNPMPANNINVSYGNAPTWIDVIRGTANDGVHSWDTTGVTPGTYSIKVTAYDSKGQESLDIGNFTFQIIPQDAPPIVAAWEPGGSTGQTFTQGQVVQIRWMATDDFPMPANNVNISYGDITFTDVVTDTANDGTLPWDTTGVLPGSYSIRITAYDSKGQQSQDLGNFTFQIILPINQPPTISVIQPAGGESWTGSSPHNIDWTANDNEDDVGDLLVWVNYSVTGGPPYDRQIAGLQRVPATSRPFAWTVAMEDSTSVILNATVVDTGGERGYGVSLPFEIDSTPPQVTSTNPMNGAPDVPTSTGVIATWSEGMLAATVQSAFSLKDTATWTPVTGSFTWAGSTITFTPGGLLAPGTEYSANFTASAKDDSDPGNSLLSPYIWTFTTASSADTTRPTIMDATAVPDPQEVKLSVNISAIIQDDTSVGLVRLNVTDPVGRTSNTTMLYDMASGRYYLGTICDILGTHSFAIWASDTSSNWNRTSGQFTCVDTTAPSVSDLRALPDPVAVFAQTDLSAIVTDNYQLANVWVEVTAPDLTATNQTMSPGARYHFTALADQLGTYTFKVSAVDTVGLWDTASSTFTSADLVPPVIDHTPRSSWMITDVINITANVTDNVQVQEVWLDFTDTSGAPHNASMAHSQQDEYFYVVPTQAQVGTLTYHFWAVDQSANGAASVQYSTSILSLADITPPVIDHTPRSSWMITAVINITANVTDNVHVQEVWLNYTDTAGALYNVSMAHSQQDEYFHVVPTQAQVGTLTYHFWAVDQSGNGASSMQYSTSIISPKPDNPASLIATLESCNSIRLQWTAPTTNEDGSPLTDLAGYNLYRSLAAGMQGTRLNTNPVLTATYLDSDLANNVTYYYTVRAVNSLAVESEQSNEAYAVTAVTCGSNGPGDDTSPFQWVVIVLVIVLIVILSIVAIILMKRRKREVQSEQDAKPMSSDTTPDEGKKWDD